MDKNKCPRCEAEIANSVLYKCVRCFTVYCKECHESNEGKVCPQCRMSQRLILAPEKKTN